MLISWFRKFWNKIAYKKCQKVSCSWETQQSKEYNARCASIRVVIVLFFNTGNGTGEHRTC